MGKGIIYSAKQPDRRGIIHYTEAENAVWHELITRQRAVLPGRACDAFVDALDRLDLPEDRVPQCAEVSAVLSECTGWRVEPVPALIPLDQFFHLLANRSFPAASFIRAPEELDYLEEPDIFHEIFGHTPHLTDRRFAAFTEAYGKAGLAASDADRDMLARLYWFTVEFGLVRTADGPRSYGAGICSSPGETLYATGSGVPDRVPFDPIEVLRTPYRIDIFQPRYFVLESFDQLFDLARADLPAMIREARRLGDRPPLFPPIEEKKSA